MGFLQNVKKIQLGDLFIGKRVADSAGLYKSLATLYLNEEELYCAPEISYLGLIWTGTIHVLDGKIEYIYIEHNFLKLDDFKENLYRILDELISIYGKYAMNESVNDKYYWERGEGIFQIRARWEKKKICMALQSYRFLKQAAHRNFDK